MNCSQPGTDKLRINTVIITYYGNLIRNLNPMIKEIVHSLNRSVIRRKRQCLYFKETGKQFFIPAKALSLLPRNYDQTRFAAETALLFHCLFKSVPSAGITVLICLCDKQCPVISTGIQVFSNLISTGIIVNSYILEGVFTFRICIDQYHLFVQFSGQLSVSFLIISQNDQTLNIPPGSHVYYIFNFFPADKHDEITFPFCFCLYGSDQFSHKWILK